MKYLNSYHRIATLLVGTLILGACASPLTKQLYLQSGRAHIYHPTDKESKQAGQVLSEIVSYQTKTDTIQKTKDTKPVEDKSMKTLSLNEVTVTAERPLIKTTTIRNGKINLSFLITLPKTFMNEQMQVVMRPLLQSGDSTIQLPPVVLQGKEFLKAQAKQYAQIEQYQKGLVGKEQYDSVFFQSKKHDKYMGRLQNSYFQSYKRDFRRQQSYERWRRIMEERYRLFNASAEGRYDARYHQDALNSLMKAYNDELKGVDTTSYRSKITNKYTAEHRAKTLAKTERKLNLWNTPLAYRDQVEFDLTYDKLITKTATEKDSLEIAKHTYNFKGIAENESKQKNQDLYSRYHLYFPKIDNAALTDSMRLGKDFVYLYSQDIEVTSDLARKLKLVLDTQVTATDKSSWRQKGVDSLTFIVSGMNDLADKKAVERYANEPEKYAEYQAGLDRLAVRDYRGALNILNKYPDYNSAVCLAALGHNENALKILDYLGKTGKTEYLRAILYVRLKRTSEAKSALVDACKKESYLAFKAETEPEFTSLMEDASFKQQILDIGEGVGEVF